MDTGQEMLILLWMVTAVLCLFTSASGEIRCYCNDASCVRTGYMCKSAVGRCFSQLTYERDSTTSVHGCSENLPLQDHGLCEGSGNIAEAKTGERVQWPILLCCKTDMCNYMDNLDINIYITKSNGSKDSSWGADATNQDIENYLIPGNKPAYQVDKLSQRDLWFKAAVIAVPIAGGFILILLVLLAVRVLKKDNRHHRQLMQMRHHHSLAKAQLYVADHFYHNEVIMDSEHCTNTQCHKPGTCKHNISNNINSNKSKTSIHMHSDGGGGGGGGGGGHMSVKTANVYRDVQIKIDSSKHRYEKIRPSSDCSILEGSCSSIVLWGDPNQTNTAASV